MAESTVRAKLGTRVSKILMIGVNSNLVPEENVSGVLKRFSDSYELFFGDAVVDLETHQFPTGKGNWLLSCARILPCW